MENVLESIMQITHSSPWPGGVRARIGGIARIALCLAVALGGRGVPATAQPPEHADPSLAPWFQGLRQPGTGVSCCSMADCRATDYRPGADGYEALIEGEWMPVPPDRVLHRVDNPIGRAVVCYVPGRGILCFVTPDEA